MLLIEQFKRIHTAKDSQALRQTPEIIHGEYAIPRECVFHYVTDSMLDMGMRGSNPLIRNYDNKLSSYHVEEGFGTQGSFVIKNINANSLVKGYLKKQKRFRRVLNLERSLSKPKEVIVIDYSLYRRMYKYPNELRSVINDAQNLMEAYVEYINTCRGRNQIIALPIPTKVPELGDFKIVFDKLTTSRTDDFPTFGHQLLLEIYRGIFGAGKLTGNRTNREDDVVTDAGISDVSNLFITLYGDNTSFTFNLTRLLNTEQGDAVTVSKQFIEILQTLSEQQTVADTTELKAEVTDEEALTAPSVDNLPEGIKTKIVRLASVGKLTKAEQDRLAVIYERSQEEPHPTSGIAMKEFGKVTPDIRVIPPKLKTKANPLITSEGQRSSVITSWDRTYRENVRERHITACFNNFSDAGFPVTQLEITPGGDALNDYNTYSFKVTPVEGVGSSQKVPIPNMNNQGEFIANGTRYHMDTQMIDVPLRKLANNKAAITSYAGKVFVRRSELVKYSVARWLTKHINAIGLDPNDNRISKIKFGLNKIPEFIKLPRCYTDVMPNVTNLTIGNLFFDFNYKLRETTFGKEIVAKLEKNNLVVCAKDGEYTVTMDMAGNLLGHKGDITREYGNFMTLIPGLGQPPVDLVTMGVYGKALPIGYVLSYHLGLTGLFKKLNTRFTKVPVSEKVNPAPGVDVLRFEDFNIVFTAKSPADRSIFAAFINGAKAIRAYKFAEMDQPENIADLLTDFGTNPSHMKELDHMKDLFIDPIAREWLVEHKEPTDMVGLYIRCAEMLATDDAPKENDPKFQILRRTERVVGALYKSMYDATRVQRTSVNPSTAKVSFKPREVWQKLVSDSTTQLVADANPIHQLKEQEAVSLAGEGGRTALTLVKRNRAYNPGALGVISEAGPDSSKVGVRSYTSASPKVFDTNGTMHTFVKGEDTASVLSTTALTLPGLTHDDSKRQVLASVQQSAVVAAAGYQSMPICTGYERVIASRCSNRYAFTADRTGVITKVTDKAMAIKYDDGEKEFIELGTVHGVNAGDYVPHQITTDMKAGDKFEEGDVLAWNTGFFERDFTSPKNVTYKTGMILRVAFCESDDNLEDGSGISEGALSKLVTKVSVRKTYLLDANSAVKDLVKVGDKIEFSTPLLTIFDKSVEGIMDEESSRMLGSLAGASPKAETHGVVSKIEAVYMGDGGDFSESVNQIIDADNARRLEIYNANGKRGAKDGRITESTYFGGELVTTSTVAVSIYIDHDLGFGDGDKVVISNQLKSITGRIIDKRMRTEDDVPVDINFSFASQNDRIVDSATQHGYTFTVCMHAYRLMTDAYFD